MHFAHCALVVATLLGWADINLQPSRGDRVSSSWQQSIGSLDRPSERTIETLRRQSLERRYRSDVDGTLASLQQAARTNPEPDLVFALAELSWIEGRRLDRRHRVTAIDRYLDVVAYAYDFLFDPDLADGRQPSDPRFRLACDLYNGGLDRLIRAARSKGPIEPGGKIRLKIHGKEQTLLVELQNSPWTPDDVDELLMSADFEVTGLPTRTFQYGLGVPLIGVRRTDHAGQAEDRFYPPEMAFPLTAFLRPKSCLHDANAQVDDSRVCTLELVDPVRVQRVGTPPNTLAVEADLTTPLAYMWSHTDLGRFRLTGLLRPAEAADRAGLMLLRPYEPNKIPVVMVHGLASSPLAWIPMINDLLSDQRIQEHYQFFLYLYPTGVPIPIAAAGLRDWLNQAQRSFNADGNDPYFMQMVLLGHSMGGLLSHAMAVDSGNRFWELNTDRPFDEMIGPPEVLDELKRYMFFHAEPFVRRVVFLATPHRGSELSRGVVGRVSSGLISEPDYVHNLLSRLIKDNPDAFDRRRFRRFPTSIETLEPDSQVLLALLAMTPNPGVTFHSIIGALRPGPIATTSDGVVSYRSAHLDGVASERVVRSHDHGVQKDLEAIAEVRRILLEHLNSLEREGLIQESPAALPASVTTNGSPADETQARPD
jgi:pimeloyl-ACP methyl ester carboxylesterase